MGRACELCVVRCGCLRLGGVYEARSEGGGTLG